MHGLDVGALMGITELSDKALLWEEVSAKFDPSKERLQEQNYQAKLALRKLK